MQPPPQAKCTVPVSARHPGLISSMKVLQGSSRLPSKITAKEGQRQKASIGDLCCSACSCCTGEHCSYRPDCHLLFKASACCNAHCYQYLRAEIALHQAKHKLTLSSRLS